jgi:hypothetical protein
MAKTIEIAINRRHEAVNNGELSQAAAAVTNPIVVLGPKGAGPISPLDFADWVAKSGIKLESESSNLPIVAKSQKYPLETILFYVFYGDRHRGVHYRGAGACVHLHYLFRNGACRDVRFDEIPLLGLACQAPRGQATHHGNPDNSQFQSPNARL